MTEKTKTNPKSKVNQQTAKWQSTRTRLKASMVAPNQIDVEFCNTIPPKADIFK